MIALVAALGLLGVAGAGTGLAAPGAGPEPGMPCAKEGQTLYSGSNALTCKKKGKELIWVLVPGASDFPQPKVGKACAKAGQVWSSATKGIACTPRAKKLVWLEIKGGVPCVREGDGWAGGGAMFVCTRQGKVLAWLMQGGGGGGGGSFETQPVPADGKWRVPEGFPDDLPPWGWRGEPTWFMSNWDIPTAQRVGSTCTQYPLTRLVTDLGAIESITGQGFMQPGSHALPVPHMYYNTGEPTGTGKDENGVAYRSEVVDVYAPADMVLRGLVKQNIERDGAKFNEYMIAFSVCDRLWFTTNHIDDVNPDLIAAAQKSPKKRCQQAGQTADTQDCFYEYLRFPIKAGTLIGKASGRAHGFDFAFVDTTKPVEGKLDPSAFTPRWAAAVCHLDYYAPELRAQLAAKLSGDNGCGQFVSDVAGTASGVWLAEGKRDMAQMEDFHIALAKHWSAKGAWVMSIGRNTSIPGLPAEAYLLNPSTSGNNRAFVDVKAGEVVCYDKLQNISGSGTPPSVYITMTTGSVEKLRIVGAKGACPSGSLTMPTGATTFERRNTLT